MSDKDSGPEAGAKGVVEGVKGRAKEAVGAITGNVSRPSADLVYPGEIAQWSLPLSALHAKPGTYKEQFLLHSSEKAHPEGTIRSVRDLRNMLRGSSER